MSEAPQLRGAALDPPGPRNSHEHMVRASEAAAAARLRRSEIKRMLRARELDFRRLFDLAETDPFVKRMQVAACVGCMADRNTEYVQRRLREKSWPERLSLGQLNHNFHWRYHRALLLELWGTLPAPSSPSSGEPGASPPPGPQP